MRLRMYGSTETNTLRTSDVTVARAPRSGDSRSSKSDSCGSP